MKTYKLIGKEIKECSIEEYVESFTKDRHIKKTEVLGKLVSTIFLGIDYSFNSKKPVLFETMIFPDEKCFRYCTYDKAITSHDEIVELIKKGEIQWDI